MKMVETKGCQRLVRLLFEVAIGAFAIAATAWGSAEAACRFSARAGIATAVVLALAAATLSFRLHAVSIFFAAILGLTAGVIGALTAGQAREAMAGGFIDPATTCDACEHPEATRFRFKEARVLADRLTTLRIPSTNPRRPGATMRHVAPIVDAGWTSGIPVCAWAAATGDARHTLGWKEPLNAAIRIASMAPEADFREAIRQSGLPTCTNAALLTWVSDPAATIEVWRRDAHAAMPVFGGFWLATMLGIAPIVRWRLNRRRESKPLDAARGADRHA